MEAVMSSASSSKQIFVKKYTNRGGFSPLTKTLFTRPELGFFRFQNGEFSKSISLQLIKAIEPVSCPISFPSSQVAEESCMMTEEAPIQETDTGKTVHVRFLLQKECMFGERFLLVGDDPILGMWNPSNAMPLDWSEGHFWSVELDIPVGRVIRFKFVLEKTTEELEWQLDPDRILQTWETKNTIVVSEDWANAEAQQITEEEPVAEKKEELTADNSSELNLLDDMSNLKGNLVVEDNLGNPIEVLLIEDNMSYLEELLDADNMSNPEKEQTVAESQDLVGSSSIAVMVNKPTSENDEDDLVNDED